MTFKPYSHHQKTYDLSHLDDFELTFIQAATATESEKSYRVLVTFTDHAFTDEANEDGRAEHYSIMKSKEGIRKRYFNLRRWTLSLKLRELIAGFGDPRNWFYVLRDGDYFRLEMLDEQNKKIEYDIFFDLVPRTKPLSLVIKSAYERLPNSTQSPEMNSRNRFRFFTLLHSARIGKRIHAKY